MVRLRAATPLQAVEQLDHFNSSVVRLRVANSHLLDRLRRKFQFQCGAIEGAESHLLLLYNLRFQFQCGAIEGTITAAEARKAKQFQFQCGAIEGYLLKFAKSLPF